MLTNLIRGDGKYYYQIHCDRQKAMGNKPLSYPAFTARLRRMNLHDAIYTPRAERMVRDVGQYPIQDEIRRKQINKQENIQISDLKSVDNVLFKKRKANKITIPKPKKTLIQKIKSWIKRS